MACRADIFSSVFSPRDSLMRMFHSPHHMTNDSITSAPDVRFSTFSKHPFLLNIEVNATCTFNDKHYISAMF